jgi:phosphoribosylanthranilate isomerase
MWKEYIMKVKICGLSREEDITYVNEVEPDYVGFVFTPSKRQVSPDQAAKLRKLLSPGIEAVGVFVNTPVEEILSLLVAGVIDIAQLHGSETETDIRRIKSESGKTVIKAVQVRELQDVYVWQESSADYLLCDSGSGSGITFDWKLLAGNMQKPFFLAGGLHAGNLAEACAGLELHGITPYGLDVSSGVETEGKKDLKKIKEFMSAAKQRTTF